MDIARLTLVPEGGEIGRATIFSIFPFPISLTDPGLPWTMIPPCGPGEAYARYDVTDRIIPSERGDAEGTYIGIVEPARKIAKSLIRDCKGMGIWVGEGSEPTEEELAAAHAELPIYARKMVNQGNAIWMRYRHTRHISKHSVWAANYLHEKPEWAFENAAEKVLCRSCQMPIPKTAAKCGHCKAILDWNRAAAYDLEILRDGTAAGLVDPEEVKRIIAEDRAAGTVVVEEEDLGEDALTEDAAALAGPGDTEATRKATRGGRRLGRGA